MADLQQPLRSDVRDAAAPAQPSPVTDAAPLRVRNLRVALPNGTVLIDGIDLDVSPGEVVVLLGGSGAGKSTFARVLFERDELTAADYRVTADELAVARDDIGLVPQRGALFDHLDVRDNIALAQRYATQHWPSGATADADAASPQTWLTRVGLPAALAEPGHATSALSGGQAQRVAVARVLASQRRLIFLDEPSVGLDPLRVRMLARLLREQVRALGVAAIVVTHDIALAAGVADRLFLLSLANRKLEQLFAAQWPGALESPTTDDATRGAWMLRLEAHLVAHLEQHGDAPPLRGVATVPSSFTRVGRRLAPLFAPFGIAATALARTPRQLSQRTRDFATVFARAFLQAFVRPLLFYVIVSSLIGYTVLYVISKVGGAGVRADAILQQLGGAHIVALAPALSALLFVAASASAVNAWLGSMGLTKQTLALDALGIDSRNYLWAPTWVALGLAYLGTAAVFIMGMIGGGYLVCRAHGVPAPWALLTGDLFDPRPERALYVVRAVFLLWMYAWGMASDTIAKGAAPKHESQSVTRAMTASVVACTLWVVGLELVSIMVVLQW